MHKAWNLADPTTRESVADKFFEDRINKVKQSWFSFVENQRAGLLPDSWNAMFATSRSS